jgi:hypothetical protein
MRCKRTGKPLPAIWNHPDLDGQKIAALTRTNAYFLIKVITGKTLDASKFVRTGNFAWRERVISTEDALTESLVQTEDMK